MTETFRCPSCSAPLEFEGKMMQKCKFCQSNVIVPANLMQNSNDFGGVGALENNALQLAEMQKLIRSGQKIYAIKLFRETFGVGLKEAKDAVDAMEEGKSIGISGMEFQTTTAPTIKISKGGNRAVGSSFLGTFIIAAIFIIAFFAVVIYFVLS